MAAQCAGFPRSELFLFLLHVVLSWVLIQISEQAGHTKQGPFCDSGEQLYSTLVRYNTALSHHFFLLLTLLPCMPTLLIYLYEKVRLISSRGRVSYTQLKIVKWLPQDHTEKLQVWCNLLQCTVSIMLWGWLPAFSIQTSLCLYLKTQQSNVIKLH